MADSNMMAIIEKRLNKTAEALRANNMEAYVVNTKEDAAEKVMELIPKGSTVANGGSMSVGECGIYDMLRNGDYNYLDRTTVSPENIKELYRKCFCADVYLSSSNAITEDGVLYNVDGNSNRVAAIAYGPDSVIIVAGYNKIVANLDEAVTRVKKLAAPANTVRLSCDTYCSKTGECAAFTKECPDMTSGCSSDARICCNYLVSAKQRHKNRIKVVLVKEELGY